MSCATFRLTPDFRLGEFAVSDSHPELVQPVPDHLGPAVVRLAMDILQPIRDRWGRVNILSCYRSRALNDAVGGSETSQHLRAEAADFTLRGTVQRAFEVLLSRQLALPVGQVIYYPDRSFIHAALPSPRFSLPSFHLHWPERGLRYRVVRDVQDLKRHLEGSP